MARKSSFIETETVDKTREAIHLLVHKQVDAFVELLDDSFIWIGDFDSLYRRGISALQEVMPDEQPASAVDILEEEYTLLTHDQHLCVSYGRVTTATLDRSDRLHFTLVWKQSDRGLLLLHANVANVKTLSPTEAQPSQPNEVRTRTLQPLARSESEKLVFRDLDGSTHYLHAEEIAYIRAVNKACEVATANGSFLTHVTLKSCEKTPLYRIHKSCLVNLAYVYSICRYRATLADGTQLPIGKETYLPLKHELVNRCKATNSQNSNDANSSAGGKKPKRRS